MVNARELLSRVVSLLLPKKNTSFAPEDNVQDEKLHVSTDSNVDHSVNPSLRSWRRITTDGKSISAYSGHGHVLIGSELYIFGGQGEEAPLLGSLGHPSQCTSICLLGELYCLDLETFSWRAVKAYGDGPSPRTSCTMCPGAHDGTFILYGGLTASGDCDAYEFNIHDHRWRKLNLENALLLSGLVYGHTSCLYNNSLIFFGGTNGHSFWNDVFSLDLMTMKHHRIVTTGDAPCPRYKHQSQIVGCKMYVIGGSTFTTCSEKIDVHCLDLSTNVWEKISARGILPPSRVAHSTAYEESSGSIFMWGGHNAKNNRLQDFFAFNIDTCTWTEISQDSSCLPTSRAFHTSCFYDGSFFILGGSNSRTRFADVWCYSMQVTPPRLALILKSKVACQSYTQKELMKVP
eukprot:CAMPEP_0113940388 /NCGR_PEP_ID=MMETSP1339-20121228/6521_1 /TAXON_ID=94617 /ORGANISM="Fibrocapsa japonica" /LENGTH=402 /DNA_ID=CAMNT_0000944195 /DNA_START=160 /DNA_END=1368 /DNA_ORIENTATION=+ /assembly_acc=CAM_ASM_000762